MTDDVKAMAERLRRHALKEIKTQRGGILSAWEHTAWECKECNGRWPRYEKERHAENCAAAPDLLDLLSAQAQGGGTLDDRQRVVVEWGAKAFGADHMADKIVRAARFIEEAAEFVQAIGLPRDHLDRAINHVYSRPAGDPAQEAGGSANTLMAACAAIGLSLDDCQRKEIERCLTKDSAHFAARNEAKLREVDTPHPSAGPAVREATGRYEFPYQRTFAVLGSKLTKDRMASRLQVPAISDHETSPHRDLRTHHFRPTLEALGPVQ